MIHYYDKNKEGLFMKVYLLKTIKGIGVAGEIIKVKEGYADNFLIPNKMAVKITAANELFYQERSKKSENNKEVIASKTSSLAEKIKTIKLTIKRKMHDDGKLYASISASEIADLFTQEGLSVAKSQIKIDKVIKEKGTFDITVKLTSQLQPKVQLKVISEKGDAA